MERIDFVESINTNIFEHHQFDEDMILNVRELGYMTS